MTTIKKVVPVFFQEGGSPEDKLGVLYESASHGGEEGSHNTVTFTGKNLIVDDEGKENGITLQVVFENNLEAGTTGHYGTAELNITGVENTAYNRPPFVTKDFADTWEEDEVQSFLDEVREAGTPMNINTHYDIDSDAELKTIFGETETSPLEEVVTDTVDSISGFVPQLVEFLNDDYQKLTKDSTLEEGSQEEE